MLILRPDVVLHPFLETAHMAPVVELARQVALVPGTPVLIRGPIGSGVEKLAHYLHQVGTAADEPFVTVRCRGVSEPALHAALFGDADQPAPDAAFARARGGTLFIEEAAFLAAESQTRLAAVLAQARAEEHGAMPAAGPARIVIATTVDAGGGRDQPFRATLFERLSLVILVVPALRDVRAEVGPLAERLLEAAYQRTGRPAARMAPDALQKLRAHDWPGDRRELEAVIERALAGEGGTTLGAASIVFAEPDAAVAAATAPSPKTFVVGSAESGRPASLQELERAYVVWMLQQARGNRTAASRMLGISYPTIMKKIVDYNIDYRSLRQRRSRQ